MKARAQLKSEIGFAPDAEGAIARPFVKMVGGKRQLLGELRRHIPAQFGHYYEPFVGGGALFFDLQPKFATLSDNNPHLIAAYKAIRDEVDHVIRFLKFHEARHNKDHYYETRKLLAEAPTGGRPQAAARMIYINKTCFNGLWRVNKAGAFNVPMGDYKNPAICDAVNLRACARALIGTRLLHGDFARFAGMPAKGDFVYFDPPYAPANASGFRGYVEGGFTEQDQERLRDLAIQLKVRGVSVLLSNVDVESVRKLYRRGFEMRRVDARRAINSDAKKRGAVGELIIW